MNDEEVLGKAYDARLMRRLIRYLRPYRTSVFFALGLILFESAIETVFPLLTMVAIDRYIAVGNFSGLAMLALVYAVALAVKFAAEFVQGLTLQRTGQRIMFDMRLQIFTHLQGLSPAFYD